MRTSLRVLLAAAATLAAVSPAGASPPSAHARATVSRGFGFEARSGWDSLRLSFEHVRGTASTGTSGRVGGERWEACVSSYARAGWFSNCATPTNVTVDLPPGAATGRVRFTLTDSWHDGVAVVDLTLTDSGATPTAGYDTYAYGTAAAPGVTVSRLATVKGTVRVTARYGFQGKRATKTYALSGIPVQVSERVSTGIHVYPGT